MEKSLIRRLSLVRQLFDQARMAATNSGPLSASIAVSLCQDALELLLRGILEHWHVAGKDSTFDALVEQVDKSAAASGLASLSDRTMLTQLNKARVGIKHHAILPDETQSRDLVFRAFRAASDMAFRYLHVDLESFSLADLISRHRVRSNLLRSGTHLKHGEYKDSCIASAQAFTLMFGFAGGEYAYVALDRWETDNWSFGNFDGAGDQLSKLTQAAKLDFKKVGEIGDQLRSRVEFLELGIGYRQLTRFRSLVPGMRLSDAGTISWSMWLDMDLNTKDDAEFCLAFATDAIIRAQEFTWGHGLKAQPTGRTALVNADADLVIWPASSSGDVEILAQVTAGTKLDEDYGSQNGHLAVGFEGERCFIRADLVTIQ